MPSSELTRLEDALTAVLTLAEGVEEAELLRSRLTRSEVRRHLLVAAEALHRVDDETRALAPELDWQAWAEAANGLEAEAASTRDGVLWSLVCTLVPTTASWLRIYRSRAPHLFAQS